MLKIRVGDFKLGPKEKKAINEVLNLGHLSEGIKVRKFEEKWANFIGTKYCVVVNSGTSALIAALYTIKNLFNIKNKTKVITTPLAFIATTNAIVVSGLEPIFVDIDEETFAIKPDEVEKAIKREKDVGIILPVHLMGYPVDMDKINQLGRKYNLIVMEDAAQAHGTIYRGKKLGSFSSLGCFSFYIAHNIQAGEMGAVVTDDYRIYKFLKKVKAHGRMCDCPVCVRTIGKCPYLNAYKGSDDFDPRFYHDTVGFNFKAMEFQAALGLVQLEKAKEILKRRQDNVYYLNKGLDSLKGVLQLPKYSNRVSYLAYPIVIREPEVISRRNLRLHLETAGIETRPLFGCVPTQQPAYKYLKEKYKNKLPNADYIGLNGFYIGCHQYLTKKELDYVISTFKKILEGKK